jgi:uncharacterized protein YaiI (UPF0178 family)
MAPDDPTLSQQSLSQQPLSQQSLSKPGLRPMRIWVDADACPNVVKEILFRAAARTRTEAVFVANQPVRLPTQPFVSARQVEQGFDVADNYIVQQADAPDLVITADIPLAAEVMAKGAAALSPRGELYSRDTIRQRLNIRDFHDTLRASGIQSGGPPPLGPRERAAFASALDAYLARHAGRTNSG